MSFVAELSGELTACLEAVDRTKVNVLDQKAPNSTRREGRRLCIRIADRNANAVLPSAVQLKNVILLKGAPKYLYSKLVHLLKT